jgi:hypothetical protein
MGGSGSGWQGPKKDIVEDCLVLSIKELARAGLLKTGCPSVSWRWRSGDETVASMKLELSMYPEKGTIWLTYTAAGTPMHCTVSLVTTVPHYGGRRWWFICPIKKIRVAKLCLPRRDHVCEPASIQPDVPFMPKFLEPREGASCDRAPSPPNGTN